MAAPQPSKQELISAQLLKELAGTQYACSSLTQQSTRPANFVYRGVLSQPLTGHDGPSIKTILIKHSSDPLNVPRSIFDELMFSSVAKFPGPSSESTVIKAPGIYLYNRDTNTQIHEDFPDTTGFKSMLFSAKVPTLLPQSSPAIIGRHVGAWLRSFHSWASAPEQAALRAKIPKDDPMRSNKCRITYDSFISKLGNFPELLEGHRERLNTIRDFMMKEFEKPATEEDENWGLIHGDTWTGNILLPITGWQNPTPPGGTNRLFIIDWEYAQYGHRSYDLGQLLGDLCERKLFNGNDAGVPVLEGIIKGYGVVSDEMAFRVAIHVGVHVIGWYKRRPVTGPWAASQEAISAGLAIARDFVLKGWEKDRVFFEGTLLASLFTSK